MKLVYCSRGMECNWNIVLEGWNEIGKMFPVLEGWNEIGKMYSRDGMKLVRCTREGWNETGKM